MLCHRKLGEPFQLDAAQSRRDARKAASHCRAVYRKLRSKGARRTNDDKALMAMIVDAFDTASMRWGRDFSNGLV